LFRPFRQVRETLSQARLDRHEIAGSLGDLGTFLPLLVGMAATNGLDFAAALFFAGLFNVVTGLAFAIPMAVQPMKAIAAVALTEGLTVPQILAAGISVGTVLLVLGLTGLIDWLNRAIPRSVVRGLQMALGLSLLMKGLGMVKGTGLPFGWDSWFTAGAATLVVLALTFSRRVPAALLLFVAGVAIALIEDPAARAVGPAWALPAWQPPALDDFVAAFPKATLPQIPLSTLNSVIAVVALATDLFPERPVTARRVAISVGLMNLVACGFGGMPMCHGAGGLAGQVRFGARTNGSILFLGGVKMAVALLLGTTLMALMVAFPVSILGVMLAFSGIELALVTRDQHRKTDAFVMLLTAGACLGLGNIAIGFAIGWVLALLLRLPALGIERRES
jgi:MFS superfamily sulfate permease-like transporter